MNIARCLATIDQLCSRDFPGERGRTDVGESGPGYHIAELETSEDFWEDRSHADEVAEQYEAERDGLTERLRRRWGDPHVLGLSGVLTRSMEGEDLPHVWDTLSQHVPDVHLWCHPDNGRWIALGVSQYDREWPFQLIALVTTQDPP